MLLNNLCGTSYLKVVYLEPYCLRNEYSLKNRLEPYPSAIGKAGCESASILQNNIKMMLKRILNNTLILHVTRVLVEFSFIRSWHGME